MKPLFIQLRPDVMQLDPVQDLLYMDDGWESWSLYLSTCLLVDTDGDHPHQLGGQDARGHWCAWDAKRISRRIPMSTEEQVKKAIDGWIAAGLAEITADDTGAIELLLVDYLTQSQTKDAKRKREQRAGKKGTGTQFDNL